MDKWHLRITLLHFSWKIYAKTIKANTKRAQHFFWIFKRMPIQVTESSGLSAPALYADERKVGTHFEFKNNFKCY